MLIKFSVSNYLSFNDKVTFSMLAGKARKFSERIFCENIIKLVKCSVLLGANASGKTNLVSAFRFMRDLISGDLPRGFSNKYFRLNPNNKDFPSDFEVEFFCDSKVFIYGFSIVLSTGSIEKEYLREKGKKGSKKVLFERNTTAETFIVGSYFKKPDTIAKLNNYGEDSARDKEILFLSIINKNKDKMFSDFPELNVLRNIFYWFNHKLNVSFPDDIVAEYPYYTDSNLGEIADLLNALGIGISELKVVDVSEEVIKNKIPEKLFNDIISDLERETAHARLNNGKQPRVMLRSNKEFYAFEMGPNSKLIITTIEFSHEKEKIYFSLDEESDGTARLLDLIEILFKISDNRIFIIDEIDRCLHPAMTTKLIELFLKMAKKRDTQLIITSHESRLLAVDFLRNDEICFVIKDKEGASIINPLEKYQLRADKKVYAALFDGTLEAIPRFNEAKLESMLKY